MIARTPIVLLTLLASVPAMAADPVHDVRSDNSLIYVDDEDLSVMHKYADTAHAVVSWQESEKEAFVHARASIDEGTYEYEFRLLYATTVASASRIEGVFDVYRNGTKVCGSCDGEAYGLDQPTGSTFKIVVGSASGPYFIWVSEIDDRFDY